MNGNAFSIEYVRSKIENYGCELLSDTYINSREDIKIKCSCGNVFITTYTNFITSKFHCCRKCVKKYQKYHNKLSYEELCRYAKDCGCELITTKDKYENVHNYIDIKYKCGHIHNVQAFAFRADKNKTCPDCSKIRIADKRRYSIEEINEIINKINLKNNTSYKWIDGEYKDVDSILTLMDNEGYKYKTTLHNLYRINKIHMFHQKNPYTLENIKIWMRTNMVGYEILSTEYISMIDKLLFKCQNGHEFKMWFSNIQSGQRCPECDMSNGEKHVLNSILNNKLDYIFQYSFNDCRGKKRPLVFDYAIFKDSEKTQLWFLIEYDGELHYRPHMATSNEEARTEKFKQQQKYDAIKDQYCLKNNIPLLRIPYWEKKNINIIITDFINKLNNNT